MVIKKRRSKMMIKRKNHCRISSSKSMGVNKSKPRKMSR
jgi:hypothetical protein